ncbi:hypothetical protein NT2_15_00020 [Caenibius tardaugens NBRC 16725]|uniref:Uncharacterized protein n=1 Tax=Caenibius tardaugens NBRC 16725 TaxID=1219035 RepID=U2YQ21_9SPHN|nr:hypothetical protein [Caenibius tardaugens]GAD51045.1 hypothetical protein NT2_15_00020 [Caenibius tardaugens NBRC 16725]
MRAAAAFQALEDDLAAGREGKARCQVADLGERQGADSDDPGRLFRSDPGHYSDVKPVGRSQIAWL